MTPIVKLSNFYLKREDQNTTGSVKDRALPQQIENLSQNGFSQAVISSTGNAAISAQYFCNLKNIPLTIFVSPKTDPAKLKLLKNYHLSPKPISDAIKFAKSNSAYLLRQSTDPWAIIGYQQLGLEILFQLPQITSLYLPVGSGTTLVGISQKLPQNVKVFAVQPTANPTITKNLDPRPIENKILANALTVRSLPLKSRILAAITSGITITNSEIIESQKFLTSNQIFTSNEGALALAGFFRKPSLAGDHPLILLTGCQR